MCLVSFNKMVAEQEYLQIVPVVVDMGQVVVDNVPMHKVQEDMVQVQTVQAQALGALFC